MIPPPPSSFCGRLHAYSVNIDGNCKPSPIPSSYFSGQMPTVENFAFAAR